MRATITIILSLIIMTALLAMGYIAYIAITDYNPAEYVALPIQHNRNAIAEQGKAITITTFNIGYAGLDQEQDFFVDGGKMSRSSSEEQTRHNLNAIATFMSDHQSDIYMLQEVDIKSKRSYDIEEANYIACRNPDYSSTFATTNKAKWVPVPILHPLGSTHSGLMTFSKLRSTSSRRIKLPGQRNRLYQLFDADRAFIESRIPVDNGKELILINLHLSAFDQEGIIRKQQLDDLHTHVTKENEKGNYIIIGGDWNHLLPGTNPQQFPAAQARPSWLLNLPQAFKPSGFRWAVDGSVASNRALNAPYVEGVNYCSVIDGFLVSSNVDILSARGIDLKFEHSDHNPVTAVFRLQEAH